MKSIYLVKLGIGMVLGSWCPALLAGNPAPVNEDTPLFTENKGQVSDQHHRPRPDVLFSGTCNGMTYHLRHNGISYQLSKVISYRDENQSPLAMPGDASHTVKVPNQISIQRLDINWMGANKKNAIQTDGALEGYNNYYQETCPHGATNVRTYTGLTYKELYPGIDLHYYGKNGKLKYDYIVAAGADYRQIQLQIKGADNIVCRKDGSVAFGTPLGEIVEGAPLVYQDGKQLKARWKIENCILSFDIKNHDPSLPLLIDPLVRVWASYYGDPLGETGWSTCTDAGGNVYMAGVCQAAGTNIATTGSHQSTYGGLYNDAFLVKFNAAGVRQWGTYYGGWGDDYGNSCAADTLGNVYLAGRTSTGSGTVIATPGSHQPTNAGGASDAFLAQFNSSTGQRNWGTYYGGAGLEYGRCCTDAAGHVYLFGLTDVYFGIATNAVHQTAYGGGMCDGYLVKFNSSGVRQWATYYGGTQEDMINTCAVAANGDIVIGGNTKSPTGTGMASAGSHQAIFGGGGLVDDGFLAKLDANGQRLWGTYYGGVGKDAVNHCAIDAAGNIFITGDTQTSAGTSIATPGSFQPGYGGGSASASDAYLAKFSSAGVRQWGSYYGSALDERANGMAIASTGDLYITGYTNSTAQVTTSTGYQAVYGGNGDAFLARFTNLGARVWGTYYGGPAIDYANSCCIDANNDLYIVGYTQTSSLAGNVIASQGAHQTTFGGAFDAFIAKFNDCDAPSAPLNATPVGGQSVCPNATALLMVSPGGTISWFSTPTSTTVLGTGNSYLTPGLATGIYTYYASSTNSCFASGPRAAISLTVLSSPTISVSGPAIACSGQNTTLTASGANTYTWNTGTNAASNVVAPTGNTSYSVWGASPANICTGSAIYNVTVNPVPVVAIAGPTAICIREDAVLLASGATSYIWNSGLTTASNVVTPFLNTSYTVTGTLAGCKSSAIFHIAVFACTGIDEVDAESEIKLFPNPTSGFINLLLPLRHNDAAELKWQIFNSLGQAVMISGSGWDRRILSEAGDLKIEIDTSILPVGVYQLVINGSTYKLVKN